MLTNVICWLVQIILSKKEGNFDITKSKSEKLLIKFDNKLSFDDHISELHKKASRKIHTLSRVASYMNISKRRILMNAFFKSQFSYCPLVWMYHSLAKNGKINDYTRVACKKYIPKNSRRLKCC